MALRDTIFALFAAFAVTAGLCPYAIPFLHRLKFGQQVRDDGPQSHLKKQGTPTMGGIMFIVAAAAVVSTSGGLDANTEKMMQASTMTAPSRQTPA